MGEQRKEKTSGFDSLRQRETHLQMSSGEYLFRITNLPLTPLSLCSPHALWGSVQFPVMGIWISPLPAAPRCWGSIPGPHHVHYQKLYKWVKPLIQNLSLFSPPYSQPYLPLSVSPAVTRRCRKPLGVPDWSAGAFRSPWVWHAPPSQGVPDALSPAFSQLLFFINMFFAHCLP
jgi:hypothetical protein